jgi:RNA-directed DNA polymerase
LSVLDEHIAQHPGGPNSTNVERRKRKRHGKANIRLVRYADDWVALVSGTREHAEDIRAQMAAVLAPMGLRLSPEKTTITHIDDGLDFLGWRIQRHRKPGTDRCYVYTYPSKKALRSITRKVKTLCRQTSTNLPLSDLLARLNPVLAGWCAHFRPGVSSKTFHYLAHFTWWQVIRWLRRKHPRITWKDLRRRYCAGGWWPTTPRWALHDPTRVTTTRYRYRGAAIDTPVSLTRRNLRECQTHERRDR